MPPRTSTEKGYASFDEYSNTRNQLKQLLDSGVIDATQYRDLLDSDKVNVDDFFNARLSGTQRAPAAIAPVPAPTLSVPQISPPPVEQPPDIKPPDFTSIYDSLRKDADLLKSEGLISEEDYKIATSDNLQEAQAALSKAFGASEQAKSKLKRLNDLDQFTQIVETPSGLLFGYAKPQPAVRTEPTTLYERLVGTQKMPEVAITKSLDLPKPLPPSYSPPSALQEAKSEAIQREVSRQGLGADVGQVVQETSERLAPILEVGRGPSGSERPTFFAPQRRLGVEEQPLSIADALRRQEVLFPDDRKAMEEKGPGWYALSKALFSENPEGMIIESAPAYIARLLGIVPEMISGGIEGLISNKTIPEAVAKRIQEGRGFAGAGYDLGKAIMKSVGFEDQDLLTTNIALRLAGTGLMLDFLFPLDAGVTTAAQQVKGISKLGKAIDQFSDAPIGRYLYEASNINQPLLIQIKDNLLSGESADSVIRTAIARFSTDSENVRPVTQAYLLKKIQPGMDPKDIAVMESSYKDAEAFGLGTVRQSREGTTEFVPNDNLWTAAYMDSILAIKTDADRYTLSKIFLESNPKDKSAAEYAKSVMSDIVDARANNITMALETAPEVAYKGALSQLNSYAATPMNQGLVLTTLSTSALKYAAQKELLQLDAYFRRPDSVLDFGDFKLPMSEVDRISRQLGNILSPVQQPLKQLAETNKIVITPGPLKERFITNLQPIYRDISDPVLKAKLGWVARTQDFRTPLELNGEDWNNLVTVVTKELGRKSPVAIPSETFKGKAIGFAEKKAMTPAQAELARYESAPPKDLFDFAFKQLKLRVPFMQKGFKGKELLSPSQQEVLKKTAINIASIPDVLKKRISDNMKLLSDFPIEKRKSEAFSKSIIDGFTERYGLKYDQATGKYIDPTGLQRPLSRTDLHSDLFRDFIATIYGGEEKVVDTRKLLTGVEMAGSDPRSVKKAIDAVIDGDNLFNIALREFNNAIDSNDYSGALDVLRKVQKLVEGKKLQDVVKDFTQLTKPTAEGSQQILRMAEAEPVVGLSNFMQVLAYTFMNRKAKDIIDQTAANLAPEFVKKMRVVGQNAFKSLDSKLVAPLNRLKMSGNLNNRFRKAILQDDKIKSLYQTAIKNITPLSSNDITPDVINITNAIEDLIKSYGFKLDDLQETRDMFEEAVRSSLDPIRSQAVKFGEYFEEASTPILNVPTASQVKELEQTYGVINQKDIGKTIMRSVASGLDPTRVTEAKSFKEVLTSTESGKIIYNELQTSRNLAQASRTMDNIKTIPKTNLTPGVEKVLKDSDVSEILKLVETTDPNFTLSERALRFIKSVYDTPATMTFEKVGKQLGTVAKSGMLAGAYVPNFAYHATNMLTAPFIMLATLGPAKAKSATQMFLNDPVVMSVMENLYNIPGRPGLDYSFQTPSKRIYNGKMIAEMIASNNIQQTKEALGLSEDIVADFAKWSGKNLSGQDVGIARDTLREYDPRKPNLWYEAANYVDTRFRTAVLIDALRAGYSEQEAIQLARESLFDYSKMTDFEKDYISKILWFWSFERSAIAQTAKNLINNPRRFWLENKIKRFPFSGEMQIFVPSFNTTLTGGNPLFNKDSQVHSAQSEYSENRPFLALVESSKNDYNVYGPPLPQAETIAKLSDYLGTLMPLITAEPGGVTKTIKSVSGKVLDRASASQAISASLAALGYEVNRGEISDPSNYVDPRMMNWIMMSPDSERIFRLLVNLEPIPPEEITTSMQTFNGIAYRIPYNDKKSRYNYNLLLEAAKTVGVERALKDYASIIFRPGAGEIVPPTVEVDSSIYEVLRMLGIVKLEAPKTGERVRSDVRKQIIRELKEQ